MLDLLFGGGRIKGPEGERLRNRHDVKHVSPRDFILSTILSKLAARDGAGERSQSPRERSLLAAYQPTPTSDRSFAPQPVQSMMQETEPSPTPPPVRPRANPVRTDLIANKPPVPQINPTALGVSAPPTQIPQAGDNSGVEIVPTPPARPGYQPGFNPPQVAAGPAYPGFTPLQPISAAAQLRLAQIRNNPLFAGQYAGPEMAIPYQPNYPIV